MLSCKTIRGVIMDDNIRKTKQELSIQKWKQLIEDFNNSDMTLSEWCDSNHVGKATYYKYLRLIRNNLLDNPSLPAETVSENSFVPVSADLPESEPVIIKKGSIRIEIKHDSDLNTIMNMIRVLLC